MKSYPSFVLTISPIRSFNFRRSGETTFELRKRQEGLELNLYRLEDASGKHTRSWEIPQIRKV